MTVNDTHGRKVEESVRSLFYGTVLAFSWRELGKLWQTTDPKAILVAEN
jgi:hypothetical protein